MELYDHFIAYGRSLAAILTQREENEQYTKALFGLFVGAGVPLGDPNTVYWLTDDTGLLGFQTLLQGPVPESVIRRCSQGHYEPNRRSAAGKALNNAIKALDAPSATKLCIALCGQPWCWMRRVGQGLFSSVYTTEEIGGVLVISGPAGCLVPYDARAIKRSEYWRMREDAGEVNGATRTTQAGG